MGSTDPRLAELRAQLEAGQTATLEILLSLVQLVADLADAIAPEEGA